MENPSTDSTSFEERLNGISVGVLIIMSQELNKFLLQNEISEDDFQTVLVWFDDMRFDVTFILAKNQYFEMGINSNEAYDIVESWQEGYETIGNKSMMYVIRFLIEELEHRIEDSQSNFQGSFECVIRLKKGRVSATQPTAT